MKKEKDKKLILLVISFKMAVLFRIAAFISIIFFEQLIVVEGARLLRDRRAGETLKSGNVRMWLTACPAESEHPEKEIDCFQKHL